MKVPTWMAPLCFKGACCYKKTKIFAVTIIYTQLSNLGEYFFQVVLT